MINSDGCLCGSIVVLVVALVTLTSRLVVVAVIVVAPRAQSNVYV